ncbi:chemotaxis protein CheA [Plesiomonas sp.]|uniref:chemotaxis protein CheA n=1 Tax=Plesiomonas sp. TaxID=2486279 RepID=UPI003F2DFC38
MSFELDEEILHDFLIEAGEIIERLSEQLVELEQQPNNKELLNAIFRGFHTVKGGAGFLSLTALVDTCHGAENVFDVLRNGKRSIDPNLMDVILLALDTIVAQFQQIQQGDEPEPAASELLHELHQLCDPEMVVDNAQINVLSTATEQTLELMDNVQPLLATSLSPANSSSATTCNGNASNLLADRQFGLDDISDDEFESLLDELHGVGLAPCSEPPLPNENAGQTRVQGTLEEITTHDDAISDDEFERLLDDLHGTGQAPNSRLLPAALDVTHSTELVSEQLDSILDDEFERLLDDLHGIGKGPVLRPDAVNATELTPVLSVGEKSEPVHSAQQHSTIPVAESVAAQPSGSSSNNVPSQTTKNAAAAETTLRVDTKTLDEIMNMVGELVLVRNRLVSLGLNSEDEEMAKACANLDVVTADLQGAVMKTRMQPIRKVFGRFPRVVRDLARSLKKEVQLELSGEDTDLDKNLVEALADPLVHLVRNAVDHGIEMPEVRQQAGKPIQGSVRLSASQEGDHILLIIEDDGAGMDANKLRSIAVNRGMMDEETAARLSDNEAYALIFAPGFSTKKEISDISGRGVGMDVVKTSITKLNGAIHIDSEQGRGTRLEIKVPLTLAILPTLMVGVAEQTFALPLACVNEIFHLDLGRTNTVDGQLTTIVRNKAIPLFYLQDWLAKTHCSEPRPQFGHVVIVQIAHQRIGFVVDTLIGQEEVVIKALDKLLQGTPGMAGATITSDGGIALILDVPGLLKHYTGR